jgi:O-methyltransferase domain/Dimerisation domain
MSTSHTSPNSQIVEEMLRGYRTTQMLHVIAKLGVADHLAAGSCTAAELAQLVGANADALYRLLRALAALGIFTERSDGQFDLTEAGASLRSDIPGSIRKAAILYGESWWWNAWGGLFETVRTGQTAFNRVHAIDLFDYLRTHFPAAELFNDCMHLMTSEQGTDIVSAIDFSSTRKLIDVGGGHAALTALILAANPNIHVILFDSPEVIATVRTKFEALGIPDQCELVAGDFFHSVPLGGDTYVLKDILHDWDDQRATDILRNVNRAMNGSGQLLVIERTIPAGNSFSPGKLVDISMLVLTGGRERTETEYRSLLSSAGFSVKSVVMLQTKMMVMAAEPG